MTTEYDRPENATTDSEPAFALQIDTMQMDELGRVLVPHSGKMPIDAGSDGQDQRTTASLSLLPDSFCPPQVSGSSCERPRPPPPSNDLCTCVAQCGCGPGLSNCA